MLRGRKPVPIQERFCKRFEVDPLTGCWNWTGATIEGYGVISQGRKTLLAHKVSYELKHGSIPEGARIGHRCPNNRRCVNPDHLCVLTRNSS